jgi:hypothetical protein
MRVDRLADCSVTPWAISSEPKRMRAGTLNQSCTGICRNAGCAAQRADTAAIFPSQ